MSVNRISRRGFIRRASSAALTVPFVLRHRYRLFAQSSEEYPERAVRLVRESLVIDMLNQFLYRMDKEKVLNDWLSRPGAFPRPAFKFSSNRAERPLTF